MDYPEDPQHPPEYLFDPLYGAPKLEIPEGQAPVSKFGRHPAGRVL
jgi:hypothetical protein